MLLTIITPTILRTSLAQTCKSVDEQGFDDFEHICMVDRPESNLAAITHLMGEKRIFILCDRAHGNWGNACRHGAFSIANGEYICYIDDDDECLPGAFQTIADAIEKHPPAWLLFPALVGGNRWLKIPPGKGSTVSCQFAYRKDLGIPWPDSKEYSADGDLVEQLLAVSPPYVLDCHEPLVKVTESRYGAA